MADDRTLLQTIGATLAPVHPDGYKFVAAFGLVALILFWVWQPLGWIGVVLTLWCAYFFRDPERATPIRKGLVVSPADGRVSNIQSVIPPSELELGSEPRIRISIFLSVLDVHIVRAPIAGPIEHEVYTPGRFLNAELDKASEENERRSLVIRGEDETQIGCVLIAGLIARRIVTFRSQGHTVRSGERIGLVRFGSRADIYLPPGRAALVAVGQRAIGGETVLADLASDEGEREARID